MCGIVGYIGEKPVYDILINGLKKLEYRGYDSSGVMIYNNELLIKKSKGKVSALENLFSNEKDKKGRIGIGHTRWATHGPPNQVNSHPHISNSGKISLVHNGIIENYDSIKKILLKLKIKKIFRYGIIPCSPHAFYLKYFNGICLAWSYKIQRKDLYPSTHIQLAFSSSRVSS